MPWKLSDYNEYYKNWELKIIVLDQIEKPQPSYPGVDLGWCRPWGKQRGGGPFVILRKKNFNVESDIFKTR